MAKNYAVVANNAVFIFLSFMSHNHQTYQIYDALYSLNVLFAGLKAGDCCNDSVYLVRYPIIINQNS